MRRDQLTHLLATTIFCGGLGLASPAFAQDEEPAVDTTTTAQGEGADESNIVVTGTRIRSPNLSATSPVTVVNSQEVRLSGTTRAEDLINSLPQAFAAQGGNISNASTGTATINLRGLGQQRTLVLINGRRLLPGDPASSAADINAIPAFMIDRVDVLTGGASSVYGADAVAGVVNFVMDTDFEGIRLDSQYSFYQHENSADETVTNALNAQNFGFPTGNVADGGTFDIGISFGVGFDDGHGHITAYAGYRRIDPVLQGKRDYSACALDSSPTAGQIAAGLTYACGGSPTSANGTLILFDSGGVPANFTSTFFQIGPNRTLLPGFTPYNFGPTNYFQRPDERYTAGLFAEYEISRALQPYMEFMFMDDRTVAQIAPSGNFGNTFSLNCDNPLLSAQQRSIICDTENLLSNPDGTVVGQSGDPAFDFVDPITGATYNRGFAQILRRGVESGPRRDDRQHTAYRIVAGMRGDLDDVWSYDAFYQYGRTNFADTYLNDFSITRLGRALDVIIDPNPASPTFNTPICRAAQVGGTDAACVPWDIFGGNPSQASVNYLSTPGFQRGIVEQTVAGASLTGNFGEWGVQLPWASSGVGVALGVEYRKEALDFQTDIAFQTGDLSGQGAAALPVNGSYDVREAFVEVRVPIVEEGFIHELALEGGYRYSDYGVLDRSFSTDTYKIAGFFAPIRDVRFRGGYNRAVRAPNIQELFAPNVVALDGATDPCSGRVLTAADLGCLAQGLSVGQFVAPNPAAQYNGLLGGNVNLTPEVADTYTVGVVFQPGFLPRFALTIDWFDIQIDNAVSTIGADTILNVCGATQDPFFCGLINRDQFGSLWRSPNGFVTDLTQNIGGLGTRGVDIGVSYSYPIDSWGNLGFQFNGTWLDKLTFDTGLDVPNIPREYDCVGLYGNICGVPSPEWRHTARLSWNHPDGYGLSVRWRYFGHVLLDATSDNPNLNGPVNPTDERLGDQNYIDLTANFRIGDHYNFRLGVNNLFDQQPPLTGQDNCPAGPCNGNTWAQVYDALGRYIFAGVTLDF